MRPLIGLRFSCPEAPLLSSDQSMSVHKFPETFPASWSTFLLASFHSTSTSVHARPNLILGTLTVSGMLLRWLKWRLLLSCFGGDRNNVCISLQAWTLWTQTTLNPGRKRNPLVGSKPRTAHTRWYDDIQNYCTTLCCVGFLSLIYSDAPVLICIAVIFSIENSTLLLV